jgi:hypothetical protein
LLNPAEIEFFDNFDKLSKSAQCLYLRLCARSTTWFQTIKINYPEIDSLSDAMLELVDSQFILFYKEDVLMPDLLHVLSKETCLSLARKLFPQDKIAASISKAGLVDLLSHQPYLDIRTFDDYISPVNKAYYAFSTFLFFGTRQRDLTEFVVRDLGHRQFVDVSEEELIPYFSSRLEIDQ